MNEYEGMLDVDSPELPDDLNYAMAQREILKLISKDWALLKTALGEIKLPDHTLEKIENFDKLLNYWL